VDENAEKILWKQLNISFVKTGPRRNPIIYRVLLNSILTGTPLTDVSGLADALLHKDLHPEYISN